jgi:NAD(P)-dependent dehydrogenase (short-subunit alcohol dehydrogenase family)
VRLRGEVALVSGGSRGIGRAVALALAREGAAVGLLARGAEALHTVAGEIAAGGGQALAVPADAADEAGVAEAVAAVSGRLGPVSLLVTAQGTGTFGPVEASRADDWDLMMSANLRATYLLCRAVLAPMLAAGRGTIVNVISLAAIRPIPGCAAYTASKAGVLGFTRVLAEEVRRRGVRVAALCPGAVDTPFWDSIPDPPDRSRMLRPESVAEAVLLIATQPPGALVEELVLTPTPGVL